MFSCFLIGSLRPFEAFHANRPFEKVHAVVDLSPPPLDLNMHLQPSGLARAGGLVCLGRLGNRLGQSECLDDEFPVHDCFMFTLGVLLQPGTSAGQKRSWRKELHEDAPR